MNQERDDLRWVTGEGYNFVLSRRKCHLLTFLSITCRKRTQLVVLLWLRKHFHKLTAEAEHILNCFHRERGKFYISLLVLLSTCSDILQYFNWQLGQNPKVQEPKYECKHAFVMVSWMLVQFVFFLHVYHKVQRR